MIYNSSKKKPTIPYYTLSKISEYFNNGIALSNYEQACIGTLSLLTTNPALALNGLFKDYIKTFMTNMLLPKNTLIHG